MLGHMINWYRQIIYHFGLLILLLLIEGGGDKRGIIKDKMVSKCRNKWDKTNQTAHTQRHINYKRDFTIEKQPLHI